MRHLFDSVASLGDITARWSAAGFKYADWNLCASSDKVVRLHWTNFLLWHQEDICRGGDETKIVAAKRNIDKYNQIRCDHVEAIDVVVVDSQPVHSIGQYNSETVGSIIDRISVTELKVYHTGLLVTDGKTALNDRLQLLINQRAFLTDCLGTLTDEMAIGKRRIMLFKQLKMYNDPTTNAMHRDNEVKS